MPSSSRVPIRSWCFSSAQPMSSPRCLACQHSAPVIIAPPRRHHRACAALRLAANPIRPAAWNGGAPAGWLADRRRYEVNTRLRIPRVRRGLKIAALQQSSPCFRTIFYDQQPGEQVPILLLELEEKKCRLRQSG